MDLRTHISYQDAVVVGRSRSTEISLYKDWTLIQSNNNNIIILFIYPFHILSYRSCVYMQINILNRSYTHTKYVLCKKNCFFVQGQITFILIKKNLITDQSVVISYRHEYLAGRFFE